MGHWFGTTCWRIVKRNRGFERVKQVFGSNWRKNVSTAVDRIVEMTAMSDGQIQSMTGFSQVVSRLTIGESATGDNATLLLELRSVNSRYLDLTFKAPDDLRHFESLLREQISAKVKRGKVECRLSLKRDGGADDSALATNALNKVALAALLTASAAVLEDATSAGLPISAPSTLDFLRWPGVWYAPVKSKTVEAGDENMAAELTQGQNAALDKNELTSIADEALTEFIQSRLREGAQTARAMLTYADAIAALVKKLETKLPDINAEIQKRFSDKVWERLQGVAPSEASKATNSTNSANLTNLTNTTKAPIGSNGPEALLKTEDSQNRINQELVMMAMRADVSEEISRLNAHIQELRKTLSGSGPVGKKLDFLMQEFNREANTLGSKAPNLEVSKASTELKLAIEQIREQVQNLE
jgi:uncharacterized protein (TIGR00255 family)